MIGQKENALIARWVGRLASEGQSKWLILSVMRKIKVFEWDKISSWIRRVDEVCTVRPSDRVYEYPACVGWNPSSAVDLRGCYSGYC